MVEIGNLKIDGKVMLAPMAGVTSLAYRKFMKRFGVAISVTEMVSDHGLVYENARTMDYLVTEKSEKPIGIQLFGSDSETLIKAIHIVESSGYDFDFIDLNLGCPVPKVTKAGAGSSLLKDPKKLEELVREVVNSTDKPVTAKIRLGWDDKTINVFENVKALENAGVKLIGIHARTRDQEYAGKPNFEIIRNIRQNMRVPLAISGDIFTLDDAINAVSITGADLVMVARGGVGKPHLVKQIDTYFRTGEKLPDVDVYQNIQYLLEFTKLLIEEKGEYRAMRILRGIAPKFLSYPGLKPLKAKIAYNLSSYNELIAFLKEEGLISK